ncbi:uncharacterized protein G2W53_033285 [Senna tora]|uniref:Uncharacterized protein n=1 Tax=Senna tora TaxID=362788 RepID=A0A834T9B5_9FABA|nr:uncharacterized protein G2W53_033285 [Senna tora]
MIFMFKRYEGHVPPEFAHLQTPLVPDEGSGQLSPEVASRSTPSLNND